MDEDPYRGGAGPQGGQMSGRLARAEFGEGVGHLWLAAGHGMTGVREAVGPRLRAMGKGRLVPLAAVATAGAAEAGKKARAKVAGTRTASTRTAGIKKAGTKLAGKAVAGKLAGKAMAGTKVAGKAVAGKRAARKMESKMARKRTRWLAGMLAAGAAAGVTGALVARRRSRSKWDEYEAQGRAMVQVDTGTAGVASAIDRDRDWASPGRTAHDWATSTKDNVESVPQKVPDPLDLTAQQFADNAATPSSGRNVPS